MNKDSAKAFMDLAVNNDTVAVLVIRKYSNPGEFRSVLMMDGPEKDKYYLDQAFMEDGASVFDFLNSNSWTDKRTDVPKGMSNLEFQVWLALQPLHQLKSNNEVTQSTIP